MELTVKQQIEVIEDTIKSIKKSNHIIGKFICINMSNSLKKFEHKYFHTFNPSKYIPILTFENATIACKEMKLRLPTKHKSGGWWAENSVTVRIEVLKWMIYKLKNGYNG